MVKGAHMVLGIKEICFVLGVKFDNLVEIKSDAGAAIGIVNRISRGKVRYIEVTQSFEQGKVSKEDIRATKVKNEENLAGALTKPVSKEIMNLHPRGVGG